MYERIQKIHFFIRLNIFEAHQLVIKIKVYLIKLLIFYTHSLALIQPWRGDPGGSLRRYFLPPSNAVFMYSFGSKIDMFGANSGRSLASITLSSLVKLST